jgi:hypothetical protein
VRGDNVAFLDNTKKFLDEIFFPYLKSNNIKTVIHLGDLVDRRKYINAYTASRLVTDYFEPLFDLGVNYHQLLGNHDCYYKNTNEISIVNELMYKYITEGSGWKIYDNAEEIVIDGEKILFLPWICQDNKEQSYEKIKQSTSNICMGHLEIEGFEMYKGSMVSHGESRKIFDKFDTTLSGHYHHRSNDGCIFYLGSHAQFTWSDYNDDRGFHTFNTKTRDLTFINNPFRMFEKIFYNDSDKTLNDILNIDFSKYKETICRVIVQNKNNPYWFDIFCDTLEKSGILNMQTVDDHLNVGVIEDNEIVTTTESTIQTFDKYIDQLNTKDVSKDRLKKTFFELYNRAMSIS